MVVVGVCGGVLCGGGWESFKPRLFCWFRNVSLSAARRGAPTFNRRHVSQLMCGVLMRLARSILYPSGLIRHGGSADDAAADSCDEDAGIDCSSGAACGIG